MTDLHKQTDKYKLVDESVLSFVYSGKDALHLDYRKLLNATNA